MLAKVSANIKTVQTYQLNGQLPDNPSCKDESSRQPASFCLESRKKKKKTTVKKKNLGPQFKSTKKTMFSDKRLCMSLTPWPAFKM